MHPLFILGCEGISKPFYLSPSQNSHHDLGDWHWEFTMGPILPLTTSLLVHRNFYWRFVKTFAARGRLLKCIWQIDIFPHSESLPNVGHTYNFWSLIFQKYSTKTSKQYLQNTCFSLKGDYWYLPSSVHSWHESFIRSSLWLVLWEIGLFFENMTLPNAYWLLEVLWVKREKTLTLPSSTVIWPPGSTLLLSSTMEKLFGGSAMKSNHTIWEEGDRFGH